MKKTTNTDNTKDIKTQTSISLRDDLLQVAKDKARQEGRTLSNWIERQILREYEASMAGLKRGGR